MPRDWRALLKAVDAVGYRPADHTYYLQTEKVWIEPEILRRTWFDAVLAKGFLADDAAELARALRQSAVGGLDEALRHDVVDLAEQGAFAVETFVRKETSTPMVALTHLSDAWDIRLRWGQLRLLAREEEPQGVWLEVPIHFFVKMYALAKTLGFVPTAREEQYLHTGLHPVRAAQFGTCLTRATPEQVYSVTALPREFDYFGTSFGTFIDSVAAFAIRDGFLVDSGSRSLDDPRPTPPGGMVRLIQPA